MKKFSYLKPKTLEEAISLHISKGDKAKYIAGGTDVMVKVNEGELKPDCLISLKKIPALDLLEYNETTGELLIGAMVTHRTLEKSELIKTGYSALHDAVSNIGSLQIRNIATIGGNLANAVPSADSAVPLIAMDAKVKIIGPDGERIAELVDFFTGPGKSIMVSGEILTQILIPPTLPRTGSAYIKFGRRKAMELPLLGVGVLISMDRDYKLCKRTGIALGVAGPTPMRAKKAEEFLVGKAIDEETLVKAGRIAADESKVRDSIRGKAWYRKEMIRVLVKRMGLKSLEIAKSRD